MTRPQEPKFLWWLIRSFLLLALLVLFGLMAVKGVRTAL